jgi:hypothetical protein
VVTDPKRVKNAYKRMAKEARYRPAAPGDGMGGIYLDEVELKDAQQLDEEAASYARTFIEEEDDLRFAVGCSNWSTLHPLVYAIEAARTLCGAGDRVAFSLLKMAIGDLLRRS